jgi:hypothetical protein
MRKLPIFVTAACLTLPLLGQANLTEVELVTDGQPLKSVCEVKSSSRRENLYTVSNTGSGDLLPDEIKTVVLEFSHGSFTSKDVVLPETGRTLTITAGTIPDGVGTGFFPYHKSEVFSPKGELLDSDEYFSYPLEEITIQEVIAKGLHIHDGEPGWSFSDSLPTNGFGMLTWPSASKMDELLISAYGDTVIEDGNSVTTTMNLGADFMKEYRTRLLGLGDPERLGYFESENLINDMISEKGMNTSSRVSDWKSGQVVSWIRPNVTRMYHNVRVIVNCSIQSR